MISKDNRGVVVRVKNDSTSNSGDDDALKSATLATQRWRHTGKRPGAT